MKDMALWTEGDWIAAIALVVLCVFLAIGGVIAASRKPEFAGHPKGLYMLDAELKARVYTAPSLTL